MRVALKASHGQYVVAEMGGGQALFSNRGAVGPWETFTLIRHDDATVSLRAALGEYVGISQHSGRLIADRSTIGPQERFALTELENGGIALRASNGLYVQAGRDRTPLSAGGDTIGPAETFQLIVLIAAPRRVSLRTANGQYVSAASTALLADRTVAGPLETFTLAELPDGTVSLQSSNGRYIGVEDSGQRPLRVVRDAAGPQEVFRLIDRGDGAIALRAVHGQYVCAEMGGNQRLYANRDAIGPWETFELVIPHERWMEGVYEEIKDKTLAGICLPGTHDSGTYELFLDLAPDAEDVIKELWAQSRAGGVGGAFGIDEFIRSMAVAQSKSFYEQFRGGIRYVDLRICWMHDRFFTCHSLRGNSISHLMKDVRRFLDENPKELIVFKVGFKALSVDQVEAAWHELESETGPNFYRPASAAELLGKRFSELVDAAQRAIFLMPSGIAGIYDSGKNTNALVIRNLQERTASFEDGGTRLLEAQFIRPIGSDDFIRAFVQLNGCRILPLLPVLAVLPFIGPILAVLGLKAMPAYLLYVRNFDPRPTSLHQTARDSRSIIREYFQWLGRNPSIKPQLLICDFFEEVPMVEIAIRISTGKPFLDLLNGLNDIPPTLPLGDRMVLFECIPSAIATTMELAAYSMFEITAVFHKLGGPFAAFDPNDPVKVLAKDIVRDLLISEIRRTMNPRRW